MSDVAPFVHFFVIFTLFYPVGFGGNDSFNIFLFEDIQNTLCCIISFIGEKGFNFG